MGTLSPLTARFVKNGVKTVAVVDLQWGDAGKGKIIDWLSEWADVIARGTGGANAGHTIKLGGREHVFHLIPSGILRDGEGKINIIGRGVAVEPGTLANEIGTLEREGLSYNSLRISHHAHLVLPIDIALDQLKEAARGDTKIGTTGRGIGPVYESHLARIGLTVNDLLNKEIFARKLKRNFEARIGLFRQYDPELVRSVLKSEALGGGIFYAGEQDIFDTDAILGRYRLYAKTFKDLIIDTDELMRKIVGRKRVLLEGAQGVLLSVLYGTYPYVTSSDCSLTGLAAGVGLRSEHVDHVVGVVKAPYMTRVGKGPFPTELGGFASDIWCNESGTRESEDLKYPNACLDSQDPFKQGVAIRRAGDEYGATTGRPRRTGWLDLPLLRYAVQYGNKGGREPNTVALTKVDVLSACKRIKICTRYRYTGPRIRIGGRELYDGSHLIVAIPDSDVLEHCEPEYREFPGWCSDLKGATCADDLPQELRQLIQVIEGLAKVEVEVLSIGAERDETIVL